MEERCVAVNVFPYRLYLLLLGQEVFPVGFGVFLVVYVSPVREETRLTPVTFFEMRGEHFPFFFTLSTPNQDLLSHTCVVPDNLDVGTRGHGIEQSFLDTEALIPPSHLGVADRTAASAQGYISAGVPFVLALGTLKENRFFDCLILSQNLDSVPVNLFNFRDEGSSRVFGVFPSPVKFEMTVLAPGSLTDRGRAGVPFFSACIAPHQNRIGPLGVVA